MQLTDKEISLISSHRIQNVALWQLVDFVPVKVDKLAADLAGATGIGDLFADLHENKVAKLVERSTSPKEIRAIRRIPGRHAASGSILSSVMKECPSLPTWTRSGCRTRPANLIRNRWK